MSGNGNNKKKTESSSSGRIRTLADLNRQSSSGSGSDNDSDAPQEYYTGGEKSGMLVQAPSKENEDVDAIFDKARQMGAIQEPLDNFQEESNSRVFTGTARLLSGETVPTAQPQNPQNVAHNIIFWSNGFTVNHGPLRRFDDPNNASFIESIKKSECPKELQPEDKRALVHVNLVKREGKCPEQSVRSCSTPFHGVARTLGSGSSEPSPSTAGTNSIIPSSTLAFSVDETLPSTSIQLRLADGTRMVSRFNIHHTVGDIRNFINASRPGSRSYKLTTVGFPPTQLNDDSTTIEQAGLANSVVMQKL